MEFTQAVILVFVLMVVFVLGASYGWGLRERHAQRKLDSLVEKVEEQVKAEIGDIIQITIEKHEGMLFVYNKNDHTFMAQGTSPKEVEDALRKRYPDGKFACDKEVLVAMGFIS